MRSRDEPLVDDPFVRVDRAAKELRKHRATVYAWMSLPESDPRHLPSFVIGDGARRIRVSDLAALKVRLEALRISEEATGEVYSMGATAIARRFDISNRSAARLLASGAVPSRWVGSQRRARPEDVEAYAAGQRAASWPGRPSDRSAHPH